MIAALVFGVVVAILTPGSATSKEQALYGVLGALLGAVSIGILFLIWNCLRAPYRQRDEEFIEGQQLREIEAERLTLKPDIIVTPKVYNGRAILEVYNGGASASFVAQSRVNRGPSAGELYRMYWEAVRAERCQIAQGETASILVGERQEAPSTRRYLGGSLLPSAGIFWLYLFRLGTSGEQTFPAETVKIVGDQLVIDDHCIIEVTITSEPPMKTPFQARHFRARSTGLTQYDGLWFESDPNPQTLTADTEVPRL